MTAPTLLTINIADVFESADNPRKYFDPAEVTRMATSMQKVGQLTPVAVRPLPSKKGKYELAAGATRLRAAKQAGLATLDAVVRPYDDAQFLEALTFENLERNDLKPLEEARSYALLIKRLEGYTVERIAERRGKSADYVRDRLRLLKLTAKAMELLESERIQLGHALELAKLGASDQTRVLAHGLFKDHVGQTSAVLDLKDESFEAAVPVAVLKRYIDEHVRIDLAHPELPHLLPATATALTAAATTKQKVVLISFGYVQPDAKGAEPIVGPGSWKRADGAAKSKTCVYPVLGVVAAGDAARGTAFTVCLNKKKCATHWPDHVKREQARARGETPAPAGRMGGAGKAQAQLEKARAADKRAEDERTAQVARLEAAKPAVLAAFVAAIKKAKPLPLLDGLLEEATRNLYGTEDKTAAALIPAGKTLEDRARRLYWLDLMNDDIFSSYGLMNRAPAIAKQFGIDLKKLLAETTPKCARCGCTEAKACKGGCSWISTDPRVCSACAPKSAPKTGSTKGAAKKAAPKKAKTRRAR